MRISDWSSDVCSSDLPDEVEALAVFVIEEVGVDRGGEARIVKLEAQIVAALVRLLGPGGADLGPANHPPVRGGVVVGAAGFGDDAHALGLDAESDDLTDELVVGGLLEGADGSHDKSPVLILEPVTVTASMAWDMTGAAAAAVEEIGRAHV